MNELCNQKKFRSFSVIFELSMLDEAC